MGKHNQLTKQFKQKEFRDIRVTYSCGVHIQQSGESVVLDKKGAKQLIKELKGWIKWG